MPAMSPLELGLLKASGVVLYVIGFVCVITGILLGMIVRMLTP